MFEGPRVRRDMGAYLVWSIFRMEPAGKPAGVHGGQARRLNTSNYHHRPFLPLPAATGSGLASLPLSSRARPAMACWALHRGACWMSGTPALRELITALLSLGICQKIGRLMVSSAFF